MGILADIFVATREDDGNIAELSRSSRKPMFLWGSL